LHTPQLAGVIPPTVAAIGEVIPTVADKVVVHPIEEVAVSVYVPGHKPDGFIAVDENPAGPVHI
jgi:hypothetical protein